MKRVMKMVFLATIAMAVVCVNAATYTQVYTNAQIVNGATSTQVYGCGADSDGSVYFQIASGAGITKINPSGVSSTLMTSGQWTTASGATTLTTFYGFGVDSSNLLFSDTGTDHVWRVNKTDGAISVLAYKADIMNVTGGANVSLTSPSTGYNGSFYVYDSTSKSVIKASDGGVSIFVSSALIASSTGGALSGGLTFDSDGRMIMVNSGSGVYRYNGSSIETLLTAANIISLIGGTATTMGDILYGPDGNVYLSVGTSGTVKNIVSFNPSDPTGTLGYVLTTSELVAGPAASSNVYGLTWYDDALAFNVGGKSGFYSVPEPATLALLALGGLVLRRSKK